MNVFRTYVKRNLKANRLRTIMTIIGIMLSMALVTAVIEGGYSGLEYLRDVIRKSNGNFHGYICNMDKEAFNSFKDSGEVADYSLYNTLGWAEINTSNTAKPYLLIKEVTPDIEEYLSLTLISGRMPENENEILISDHLEYNGDIHYDIGDTITFDLGYRAYPLETDNGSLSEYDAENIAIITNDNSAHRRDEFLIPKENGSKKTYTVCGVMPRLPYTIEDFECPGYTAITIAGDPSASGSESIGVFFRLKDPSVFNGFVSDLKKEYPKLTIEKNRELVALYGGTTDRSYIIFMYGLIIILISLILFGTIALIYNSFSISVSERTKQIGILKSTGATKKQIRKTIFYEALFECGIAIPLGLLVGCLGIGGTLYILQKGFRSFIGEYGGYIGAEYIDIKLVINIPLLILAVLLVILTTFISAILPALRASGISPLDSIRQTGDINTKRNIRGSLLLTKLFKVEGMLASKNYTRNHKRYRTTIVSLALSIILFIAASSFSSYLAVASDDEFYTGNMSLVYYYENYDDRPHFSSEEIADILRSSDSVTNVIQSKELYNINRILIEGENGELLNLDTVADEAMLSDDIYLEYLDSAVIMFIDDKGFTDLVNAESIPYDPNAARPQAVVFNNGVINTFDAEGNRKKLNYTLVDEQNLPLDVKICYSDLIYEYDGKYLMFESIDKNNDVYLVYMDNDTMDIYYDMLSNDYTLADTVVSCLLNEYLYGPDDPSAELPEGVDKNEIELFKGSISFLPKDLYSSSFDISLVGITENADYMYSSIPIIFLPYSALDTLIPEQGNSISSEEFYIYSSDSTSSEQDISRRLIQNGLDTSMLYNYDVSKENTKFIRKIINIFSFGFVLLISLVSLANVFNTISTNVALRRREFGMLKSMGLSNRGITRMLNIECLIYGIRSILLGLPIAILVTFAIYKVTNRAFITPFYIPWYSILIAMVAVMLVVFITMMYAARKVKKDNTIDAIRNENV